MKAIKLNFRHSVKTMREQLARHNESVAVSNVNSEVVYEICEPNDKDGRFTKSCGVFYTSKGCTDYINMRNGLFDGY